MNLWYRIVSGTLERQPFVSVKTDWTILLCWFCEKLCYMWSHWYSGSSLVSFSFFLPLNTSLDQQNVLYAHRGWRARQPSLDLRSKEGLARQCYTLVSMKHYVYPVNKVQLKSKRIYDVGCWCSLCPVLTFKLFGDSVKGCSTNLPRRKIYRLKFS